MGDSDYLAAFHRVVMPIATEVTFMAHTEQLIRRRVIIILLIILTSPLIGWLDVTESSGWVFRLETVL